MKKIFIMSWEQFGYHTDNYMYCKYLNDEYKITLICYDDGLPKLKEFNNMEVIYIRRGINNKIDRVKYIGTALREIINNNFNVIFMRYFRGCSFLKKILKNKNIIVDIRTASVESDEENRKKYDAKLVEECIKFDKISIISEGLRDRLGLPKDKTYILPLGADTIVSKDAQNEKFNNNEMNLLYVGTFYNRNIDKTILAFSNFYNKYKNDFNINYTIAGFSTNDDEIKKINNMIEQNSLQSVVKYIGRVKYDKLSELFEKHNFGIAYIPVNDYYNNQPPTKTYEYILNGLFCIATNTTENIKIINEFNGILTDDSVEGLENAIEKAYLNIDNYNKGEIISSLKEFTWEKIIYNNLIKILEL